MRSIWSVNSPMLLGGSVCLAMIHKSYALWGGEVSPLAYI